MKSFSELLRDSVDVSRKSVLSILALYAGMIVFGIIFGILSFFMIGTQLATITQNQNFDPAMLAPFMPQLIIIGIIFIIFLLFSFLMGFWIILIIRNNYLIGQSLLKNSFFEVFRKAFRLILLGIVSIIFFGGVSALLFAILDKMAFIILIPLMLVCTPIFFPIYYGVLCKEGKLLDIISESVSLGIRNWFRIVGFALLFIFCMFVVIITVSTAVYFLTQVSSIIGNLLSFVFNFLVTVFASCFYTLFYLDMAGIAPTQIEEMDVTAESGTPLQ